MDSQDLLAVVDNLSSDDLERLKAQIAEREKAARPQCTAEEWLAELKSIAAEFRGDSSDEEMRALVEAMNEKSAPSSKG
ncbi:MAG: hypothetical protein IT324_06960 [Anaerolineae bacterium]|nr:hypothetical protein [Anaerolineae bacterium]